MLRISGLDHSMENAVVWLIAKHVEQVKVALMNVIENTRLNNPTWKRLGFGE
jgi:hypothetical protein